MSSIARFLGGPDAGSTLAAARGRAGATVERWKITKLHRNDSHAVSAVYEVVERGASGPRESVLVAHASTRPVPPGAAVVAGPTGAAIHVWPLAEDPYLPGLAEALSPSGVRRRLAAIGLTADRVTLRRRSYRPGRRAVVEVVLRGGSAPTTLFIKVLGDRDAAARARRTASLGTLHDRVGAAGVPAPPALATVPDLGMVVLGAVDGEPLRHVLRRGTLLPSPESVVALIDRLGSVPLDGLVTADPRRYADPAQHVAVLADALPRRATEIGDLAALARPDGQPVTTVHGDLHDLHLLIAGGHVRGVIDLDAMGPGHRVSDIARLMAWIEATARPSSYPRAMAFAAGMRAAGAVGIAADVVERALAAAWLALATAPLRNRAGDWHQIVNRRVDRARECVEAAGRVRRR